MLFAGTQKLQCRTICVKVHCMLKTINCYAGCGKGGVMSEKSISIIVMRDRGKSFSLRFSPTAFRVFLSVFVLVPLLLAGSIWFGLSFYTKYLAVLEESAVLKNTIEQNRQTVTRLANLEQFLQKYSPSMLGLLVPSEEVDIKSLPVIDGDKEVLMGELAANLAGSGMSFDIVGKEKAPEKIDAGTDAAKGGKQAELPARTDSSETNGTAPADGVEAMQPVSGQETVQNTEQKAVQGENDDSGSGLKESRNAVHEVSEQALQPIDLGYLEIENFSAKVAANTVRITYRLLNLGKKVPLQGEQKYYLCSEINGRLVRQELRNPTDDSFRIKNLKNVKSTASMAGLEIGQKARFVVEVAADGEIIYRQPYPLTH